MDTTIRSTRIWWNDEEVKFITWTDKTLVFHWEDPRETAIHMPRGVIMRLLDKGVLRIEGERPDWMRPPAEVTPIAPPPTSSAPPPPSRVSTIARLIRKLAGERKPDSGVH